MPVPVVSFRSVVALADRYPVLAGVDLRVDAGEVVLLTGPNGAGKTSVLRAMAGLLAVTQGEATVLGHDLCRRPTAVRRHVGYLAHRSLLYGELTVAENVMFAVRAAGGSAALVVPALARLGLDGRLAEVTVDRLSAGQRRRTALAILVARNPRLWLLDEPHASLDAQARDLVDGLIAEATGQGATVVLSSHELHHGRSIANRHLVVEGGVATPAQASQEPKEPQYVA